MEHQLTDGLRHAIFIEPDARLQRTVLDWKARVARRFPDATYLHHPAHCTIWVGDIRNADLALDALREAAAGFGAVPDVTCRPHVFYDDARAGGGQTCVFAGMLSNELAKLQMVVANALIPYREPPDADRLPPALRREPFLGSWVQYEFPFVGRHWIPHFTIASLPVGHGQEMIAEFLRTQCQTMAAVCDVSWWRITGEHHERLGSVPLAP